MMPWDTSSLGVSSRDAIWNMNSGAAVKSSSSLFAYPLVRWQWNARASYQCIFNQKIKDIQQPNNSSLCASICLTQPQQMENSEHSMVEIHCTQQAKCRRKYKGAETTLDKCKPGWASSQRVGTTETKCCSREPQRFREKEREAKSTGTLATSHTCWQPVNRFTNCVLLILGVKVL